jgi:uncharacterized protein YcgI (DUF1989 family)
MEIWCGSRAAWLRNRRHERRVGSQRARRVRGTPSCYANFLAILAQFGLDKCAIVSNVNVSMQVPVEAAGGAGLAANVSPPGSPVEPRAECDVLAVLSNCPQMHNPCNGYNPTPIRIIVYRGGIE